VRTSAPAIQFQTFFQQKWAAKSMTRAYHGEHIREKQWQQMFTTRLPAVVPMSHSDLAENDGSEQAAGRGSGKDQRRTMEAGYVTDTKKRNIPFMHMTYAPMERRLDMAIWRALFASSARQARQFVIHGMVKVNGKKVMLSRARKRVC
jgi:ribosomal protein S4